MTLRVRPLTGTIGAEVEDVDLNRLSTKTFSEIQRAFLKFKVLFFRKQSLTVDQQRGFTLRFGPLCVLPYVQSLSGYPDVIAVLKEAHETGVGVFGGNWHTDFSFLPSPPMGSVLYAKEVPPVGGDTIWSDLAAAYAALDSGTRTEIDELDAIHAGVPYGRANPPAPGTRTGNSMVMTRGDAAADTEITHPMVCTHPDTAQRILFINPTYTTRIAGLSAERSKTLLAYLYAHCTRPEFTCRYRWCAGDVAIWDNRSTMHYAVNDYDGYRRLMYRTAISGGRPVS